MLTPVTIPLLHPGHAVNARSLFLIPLRPLMPTNKTLFCIGSHMSGKAAIFRCLHSRQGGSKISRQGYKGVVLARLIPLGAVDHAVRGNLGVSGIRRSS